MPWQGWPPAWMRGAVGDTVPMNCESTFASRSASDMCGILPLYGAVTAPQFCLYPWTLRYRRKCIDRGSRMSRRTGATAPQFLPRGKSERKGSRSAALLAAALQVQTEVRDGPSPVGRKHGLERREVARADPLAQASGQDLHRRLSVAAHRSPGCADD